MIWLVHVSSLFCSVKGLTIVRFGGQKRLESGGRWLFGYRQSLVKSSGPCCAVKDAFIQCLDMRLLNFSIMQCVTIDLCWGCTP